MEGQFSEHYRKIAFGILVALVLIAAAYILMPFLAAIMWAVVLSVLMMPLHRRFCARFNPSVGAGLTTLVTILIIFIPLAVVSGILISEVSSYLKDLAQSAPRGQSAYSPDYLIAQLDQHIKPLAERLGQPDFSAQKWIQDNKDQLAHSAGQIITKAATNAGYTMFTLVVAFLTMFFMIRDGHRLYSPALDLIPLPRDRAKYVLDRMAKTIHAVFVGVVLVAFIQGVLAGIAYWIAGVPSPLVWTFVTTILCAIPLLGAPVVYVPLSIILMAQGRWVEGAGLAAWGFLVVSQTDNLIRPFVIGSRVNLHPMAIFFSLLGGVVAMGPVGLMAGPVLLTVLLALQEVIRERLILDRG
jgi:predicted PurR-regulated permease PerM